MDGDPWRSWWRSIAVVSWSVAVEMVIVEVVKATLSAAAQPCLNSPGSLPLCNTRSADDLLNFSLTPYLLHSMIILRNNQIRIYLRFPFTLFQNGNKAFAYSTSKTLNN